MERQCWQEELPGKVQFGGGSGPSCSGPQLQDGECELGRVNPQKRGKCNSADCTLSVRWEAREGQASIGTQPERGLKIHLVKKERGLKIYLVKNESGIKIHLVKKEGG